MSRILSRIGILCLLAACSEKESPPAKGELSGTVQLRASDGSQQSVAGAELRLHPADLRTTTDAAGHFRFENVPVGTYLLRGELDTDADGRVDIGFVKRDVTLAAEQGTALGPVEAGQLGAIEGRFLDGETPRASAFVTVRPLVARGPAEKVVATDANGLFRVDGVLPGTWTVEAFSSEPLAAASAEITVGPSGVARLELIAIEPPLEVQRVTGIVRRADGGSESIEIAFVDTDEVAHVEARPGEEFEASVPVGLYTLIARDTAQKLPPVVVTDLLVSGPIELPPLELIAGEPPEALDSDEDELVDAVDLDDDDDGQLDLLDECPLRVDPPNLNRRPGACGAYPTVGLVLRTPRTVQTDVPFIARVRPTGGVAPVTASLEVSATDGLTVSQEPLDDERWQIIASGSGTLTLRGTATDALGSTSATLETLVEAPALELLTEPSRTGIIEETLVVEARLADEGEDVEWQWKLLGEPPEGLLLEQADTSAVHLRTTTPGTWTLEVEARRGARVGRAEVEVTFVAPPLPLTLPSTIELTIGEPTEVEVNVSGGLDSVVFEWSGSEGLTVEGAGSRVTIDAATAGEHTLTLRATKGAREGLVTRTIHAFDVAPIVLSTGAVLVVGSPGSMTVNADPLFASGEWTWIADASNPPGAQATPQGSTLLLTATQAGTYAFDVEARAGSRVARGRVSVDVLPPPLRLFTTITPRPIVRTGFATTVRVLSPDLAPETPVTWLWTAREGNPASVALSGTETDTLAFTPDAVGTYTFDVTATTDTRSGTAVAMVVVEGPPPIDFWVSWSGNVVGGTLLLTANLSETLSSEAVWSFVPDATNPASLELTHPASGQATATPEVAGTYGFTVSVADGERSGTRHVTFEVQPDAAPHLGVRVLLNEAAATAGTPFILRSIANSSVAGLSWQWEDEEGNPAPVQLQNATSNYATATFPEPGEYRIRLTGRGYDYATLEPREGVATVTIKVHPAIPIETWVDADRSGPFTFHARTHDVSAPVTWSWFVLEYASSRRPSLTGDKTADVVVSASAAGEYVLQLTARMGIRRTIVRITGLLPPLSGRPDDGWVDMPGVTSGEVNSPHHATLGQPAEVRVFCKGCDASTTYEWSVLSGPPGSTIEDGDQQTIRFTAATEGRYVFRIRMRGAMSRITNGITLDVAAAQPDVYIDGQDGIEPEPDTFRSRAWACRSGRTDVASYRWEKVAGDLDGEILTEGQWLFFELASRARRFARYRCTVTTTSGEEFSAEKTVVVVDHDGRYPNNIVWVKPGTSGAGAGTWDDPREGLQGALFNCFIVCLGVKQATFVLTPGVYDVGGRYDFSASGVVGSIDPQTLEQNVVEHPSTIRWAEADANGPLWRFGGKLDGLRLEAHAKPDSTNDLVMLEASAENAVFSHNVVVARALEEQRVVALQVRTSGPGAPNLQLSGNRFAVTGGTGTGALVDNCRGALWAHNFLAVDATSTLSSGFFSECDWLHRMRPVRLVNNAIRMNNPGAGFDLWGMPATDTGHQFGGNWFSGEGPFVVASRHVPAPLELFTANEVNAGRAAGGLDGGRNTDDPACFPSVGDVANESLAADASCAGAAVEPVGSYFTWPLVHDATGASRSIPEGWRAGAIDPGPGEVL